MSHTLPDDDGFYEVPRFAKVLALDIWAEVARVVNNRTQHTGVAWDAKYGEDPKISGVVVRRYAWDYEGDESLRPANFEICGLRLWFYKYMGRALQVRERWDEQRWCVWHTDAYAHLLSNDPNNGAAIHRLL